MDYWSLTSVGVIGAVAGSAINSLQKGHAPMLGLTRAVESVLLGFPCYFALTRSGVPIPGGTTGLGVAVGGLVYLFYNNGMTTVWVTKMDNAESSLLLGLGITN